MRVAFLASLAALMVTACASPEGKGLALTATGPGPQVVFDVFHRPLPEIPLPNDFATRFDAMSPTRRRLNASMVAPTQWERRTRQELDALSGWGTSAPISLSFDAPLDTENIIARHWGDRFDPTDDVILVVDVTKGSADYCQAVPLDLGQGHFPIRLDRADYYPDDPRGDLTQLQFEAVEEDTNHNGTMDPGEDTDMDGVLDHPNSRSESDPTLITFYERETSTLIAKPIMPMREKTTYAVVLTKALVGADGAAVRSPFPFINHASQTRALEPLTECLPQLGHSIDDVAFTWSFTTQSWTHTFVALRDGLYGLGQFASLSTEYPPDPKLSELRSRAPGVNARIAPNAGFLGLAKRLFEDYGSGTTEAQRSLFLDNFKFVDFHAAGTLDSPQFFPRFDEEGEQLPLFDQVWRVDENSGEAFVRREGVNFWLMVPKNRSGPAPVIIFIHGHGSTKFDAINFAGFFARVGIATIGIDATGHGVDLDPVSLEIARGLFKGRGMEGMGEAIIAGRVLDQNGDGTLDSGADYWTSYLFHTRDVVRQTAIDLMQVVRMFKSFDGNRTWSYDANRDGQPDLAGDFDGDGAVDVGGSAAIHFVGGSLGGIISSFVGGLEPAVETAVPIIGGGVLSEIGSRSDLPGVRDAMVLRMFAPLVLVRDGAVYEMAPNLKDTGEVKVATLKRAPAPGSIAVLHNLDSGEYRCARVQPNGRLRVAVSSDRGHRLRLDFYGGELPSKAPEGCVPEGEVLESVDHFDAPATFAADSFEAGSPFVAVTDGFGLRRANPELRRMLGLAQVALEAADPANSAPFLHRDRVLTYGTQESVGTRVFYINTMGDPGVPTAAGVAMARAAGLIDFRNIDPRYGKTVQQALIDTGVVESVEASGRYHDRQGAPVLMDVDNLQALWSNGTDGLDVPRLNPPLRLIRSNTAVGGKSGILFPMMDPKGAHSFPLPKPGEPGDLGSLLITQMMRYVATSGEALDFDSCQLNWSCSWLPPLH